MSKVKPSKFSCFFCALVMIFSAGCVARTQLDAQPLVVEEYRSELADPDAKALYSYAEFRLLATDNRWDEAIAALQRAVAFDAETDYLKMGLAKALLHKDRAAESIGLLRQVLEHSPQNIEALELLGDLLGYQEKNQEAVEYYQKALELDPDDEMLQMRLAMALGRLGRIQEAIDLLEDMVIAQPEAKLAHLSLARFYLDDQRPEEAKATFEKLLARHPDHQQALLEYGKLLEDEGLIAEALELYRTGIAQNPRAAAVRQQLAMLYMRQNRKAEALEQLQIVHQLAPSNLQVLSRIGLLLLDTEDWISAEETFRQLVQYDDGDGHYRYYLGLALIGQEKYQQAKEVMGPITDNSPVFVEAVLQLAYLYHQEGELEQAVSALERVLEKQIQRPEVYYYLASFYADQQNHQQAAATVAEGVKQFPDDTQLLYQAAIISEKEGEHQLALVQMERILEIDPEHAEALNFIAYYHAEKGTQLESALTKAQKALEKKRTGYIVDTLGWIYFKMGRLDESRIQLEEATSLLPDDPVILEHLGDLYRALNLWEKAAAAYQKALELDPAAEGVAEKLGQLPVEQVQ